MTTEAHHENHSDDQVGPGGRDLLPLAGRTVLVTGVSRRVGIGHAIACRAAGYGASIVAHHYRPHDASQPWGADDVDEVVAGVRRHLTPGARMGHASIDLSTSTGPATLIDRAGALGHLDVLVCNQAQSSPDGALAEVTAEVLDLHWRVDARASILATQAFAAQHDGREGGRVIWMSSGQGKGPMPGEIAYAASKAALAGLVATAADELIDRGSSSTRSTRDPWTPATAIPEKSRLHCREPSPRGGGASPTIRRG